MEPFFLIWPLSVVGSWQEVGGNIDETELGSEMAELGSEMAMLGVGNGQVGVGNC